ncbi:MAG: oligosaccharide flippase family protein [Acidobacteria bacterium]|nr:oligosaccharide flippase family protein [Acidobacteriota bacterium]
MSGSSRRIFQNVAVYAAAEAVQKAVPLALLPLLTIYLAPADYGRVAAFTAYTSMLALVLGLSMHGAVSVNFFRVTRERLRALVTTAVALQVIIGAAAVAVVLLSRRIVSDATSLTPAWLVIGTAVGTSQVLVSIRLVLWQSEQRPLAFGVFRVAMVLVELAVSVLFVMKGLSWRGRAAGIAGASLLSAGVALVLMRRGGYLGATVRRDAAADLLRFGVPLVPNVASMWLNTSADLVLITAMLGPAAAGPFAVALQLSMAVVLIGNTLFRAFEPYAYGVLARPDPEGRRQLVRLTGIMGGTTVLLGAVLAVLIPVFIRMRVDPDYQAALQYLPWLLAGFLFKALEPFFSLYLFFEKRTKLYRRRRPCDRGRALAAGCGRLTGA